MAEDNGQSPTQNFTLSDAEIAELQSPSWRQVLREMDQVELKEELERSVDASEFRRQLLIDAKRQKEEDQRLKTQEKKEYFQTMKQLKMLQLERDQGDLSASQLAFSARVEEAAQKRQALKEEQQASREAQAEKYNLMRRLKQRQEDFEQETLAQSREDWEKRQQADKELDLCLQAEDAQVRRELQQSRREFSHAVKVAEDELNQESLQQSKMAWEQRQLDKEIELGRRKKDLQLKREELASGKFMKQSLKAQQDAMARDELERSRLAWEERQKDKEWKKQRAINDRKVKHEAQMHAIELNRSLREQEEQIARERLESGHWMSQEDVRKEQQKKDFELRKDSRRSDIEGKNLMKELKRQEQEILREELESSGRQWRAIQEKKREDEQRKMQDRMMQRSLEKDYYTDKKKLQVQKDAEERSEIRQNYDEAMALKNEDIEERRKKKVDEAEEKRRAFLEQKRLIEEERQKEQRALQEELQQEREQAKRDQLLQEQQKRERRELAKQRSEMIRQMKMSGHIGAR